MFKILHLVTNYHPYWRVFGSPYRQYETSPLDYLSDEVTSGYSNLSNKGNFRDSKFVKVSSSTYWFEVVFDDVREVSGLPNAGTIPADTH